MQTCHGEIVQDRFVAVRTIAHRPVRMNCSTAYSFGQQEKPRQRIDDVSLMNGGDLQPPGTQLTEEATKPASGRP